MTQGVLPFKYVEKHVGVRTGSQGWSDAQIVMAIILLNLAGGNCVDDLYLLHTNRHPMLWDLVFLGWIASDKRYMPVFLLRLLAHSVPRKELEGGVWALGDSFEVAFKLQ
jgi:hypothetical protein